MADDITRLVLKVESQQVELATSRLRQLERVGRDAGKSIGIFADKSNRVSNNMGKVGRATDKTTKSMSKLGKSTKLTAAQMKKVGISTGRATVATKGYTGSAVKATVATKGYTGSAVKATVATNGYTGSAVKATRATNGLSMAVSTLIGPLAVIYATYRAMADTIETTATFEKIDKQFQFITGSAEAASAELDFLTESARKNALVLSSAAGPYARLAESMKLVGLSGQDTRALFEGTAAAAATFGLSADDLNGVLVAFSQVASKGTVQAEELRNQIGERIPGAFSLAAKSMGKTTEELNKMLEMGEVLAVDFLPKFAEAMSQRYSGNLDEVTDTMAANFRKLKTELELFQVAITNVSKIDAYVNHWLKGVELIVKGATDATNSLDQNAQFSAGVEGALERMIAYNVAVAKEGSAAGESLEGAFDAGAKALMEFVSSSNFPELESQIESSERALTELMRGYSRLKEQQKAYSPGDSRFETLKTEALEATQGILVLQRAIKHMESVRPNTLAAHEAAERMASLTKDFEVGAPGLDSPANGDEREKEREEKRIESAFTRLSDSLMSEEEAIEASHARRMFMAEEYATLTGKSVEDVKAKINKDTAGKEKALQQQRWDTALSSFDDFQDNMAVLAANGNSTLGAIYKAGAITQTTIKTYQAAQDSYAAMVAAVPGPVGIGLGIAAASAATAAGLARVASISQAGNYADGGIIPGGNFNGDNLTANVNSGEMILNFSQQKRLLDMANGSGGAGSKPVIVNVIGAPAEDVEVNESETDDARIIEIAVNKAVSKIDNNIRTGQGGTERALQTRDRRTRTA